MMSQRLEYQTPSKAEIKKSTIKGSDHRISMMRLYSRPFLLNRRAVLNDISVEPERPVVGAVRSILDQGDGLKVVDTLLAYSDFDQLDFVMKKLKQLTLDLPTIERVFRRLMSSRVAADFPLCAAVEVITDQDDPTAISQAFIAYPALYERSESPFVAPATIGEQMALLYLQSSL